MMTTHNSKRRKILHFFYISVILCMIFSCGGHRYPQQLLTADSLTEREFDVRKVLKKLWEWDIFSNFIGDNQTVTTKYPFP